MIAEKKIAIVSSCVLTGYGLKQLLGEYFGQIHCTLFHSVEEFLESQPDSFDIFFLPAEPVLLNYDFFLPRKPKTILLLKEKNQHSSFHQLTLHDDLSTTIDSLQQLLDSMIQPKKEESQEELTSREIEVLKLITKGMMNKEIAEELYISLNTVLTHRKNITSKLGIKTVSGLTFYAMMNGYITE